jgi:hypothetical protein
MVGTVFALNRCNPFVKMQPLCTFPILHFIKIGYDIIVWDIQYPIICFVMTSFLSTQQFCEKKQKNVAC